MNRSLLSLQQVARRSLSSSSRRPVENKVSENQKHFQLDDDVPVHLKGGLRDGMMYRVTMTLSVVGSGFALYELYKAAFPRAS